MSTRAQKVSTAFIHGGFVLIVFLSAFMVAYALYWLFYPIENVYYDVTQPYEVRYEQVAQGDIQQVRLQFCKKKTFSAIWTQFLYNGSRNDLDFGISSHKKGCSDVWIDVHIPERTTLGKHQMGTEITPDIHWLTRPYTFVFYSDYFEIVE